MITEALRPFCAAVFLQSLSSEGSINVSVEEPNENGWASLPASILAHAAGLGIIKAVQRDTRLTSKKYKILNPWLTTF